MIPVQSSKELNDIFEKAKTKSDEITVAINSIKKDITKKMQITNYACEFISNKQDVINAGLIKDEKITIFDTYTQGIHDRFGYLIHPKFKKSYIDIFNFKLLTGDTLFKDSIISKVNDIELPIYKNLLMSDNNIKKEIVFEEFKTNNIKLEFEIDNTVSLGTSRFNVIELDPFIYGAYDILSVEIYNLDVSGQLASTPAKVVEGYQSIGKTRIILDEKVKFSKVIINFKCNFETEVNGIKLYPFGLKHINFIEADFLTESYVVAEIRSDKFIEYIYNDIKLYTSNGIKETTCEAYDIDIYTNYDNDTFTNKVYTSSEASTYRIAKNTKVLYAKIPLIKLNSIKDNNSKEYLTLNGIKFNYIDNEEIIL